MVWCGKGHTGAEQHELAPAELFDRVDGDEAREKVLGACASCRQQDRDMSSDQSCAPLAAARILDRRGVSPIDVS